MERETDCTLNRSDGGNSGGGTAEGTPEVNLYTFGVNIGVEHLAEAGSA